MSPHGVPKYEMSALSLLFVPLALTVVVGLLIFTAWLEDSVLSSRSLILYSARSRSRRVRPEDVERIVAMESQRLLRNIDR
jgi:hypothetical protein